MKRPSSWLVFTLVAIAQFMVVLDTAISNVALPTIRNELHFSPGSLQWVLTAYALCFGGFLLLGGRAADLFGRRRTLLLGMIGFTLFSFLIGVSSSAVMLVALRALQGMSAAFMSPAALSIVLVAFKEGPERNKALAYWTLVATGGAAAGLLLGGVLTQYLGWRWNFFVNVPVGVIMAILIARIVPVHDQEERSSKLDAAGAVLATAALMALVFGFSQAPQWGWLDGKTLGLLILAVVLLAGFALNERRAPHPLVPLSIFGIRNVSGANLIMAFTSAGMLGMFFLMTLYMQSSLHLTPVETGLSFLPFPVVLGYMAMRTPKLVQRFGYKPFLIAGPFIVAVSYLWLLRLPVAGNYFTDLLPVLILAPLGAGATFMPAFAAATSGVPPQQSGLSSGLISTSQQMGGALGLAVLSGIDASVAMGASQTNPAVAALHGYQDAFGGAIIFLVLAAVTATVVIRQQKMRAAVPVIAGE